MTTPDTTSIQDIIVKHKPPEELIALRAENTELRNAIKRYKKEHGQLESLIHQVVAAVPQASPTPVLYKPQGNDVSSPCAVAVHLTDIHYGAVQESDEVEGFGSSSPEQCEARIRNFVQDVLDWTQIKRNGYNIPDIHVICTGDYLSGSIHEELLVTNAFPAPVQAVGCGQLLSEAILSFAPHFQNVYVHMTTDDNHGRMTRKPQAKQAGLNNWGFIVARWVEQQLANIPNVKVNVITKPWESVECNNRRYLLTHGHGVMGWAGFPYYGIERLAAKEAMKRMNAPEIRKFHKIVMGHWHAPMTHPWYWIGGSVTGTDAFDHKQGRYSLPIQVSWMIHPKHGEFDRTEWVLRDYT